MRWATVEEPLRVPGNEAADVPSVHRKTDGTACVVSFDIF